jgi:DNA-directed RNA polymerase specialized sigma subunit
MRPRKVRKIQSKISNLTDNEDHSQDLWLHYLATGCSDSFAQKLAAIRQEREEAAQLENAIAEIYKDPPVKLLVFLENFSDYEKAVMFLMFLGFTSKQISKYKNISEIRINQMVSSIRLHTAWEREWPLKENLAKKRNTD